MADQGMSPARYGVIQHYYPCCDAPFQFDDGVGELPCPKHGKDAMARFAPVEAAYAELQAKLEQAERERDEYRASWREWLNRAGDLHARAHRAEDRLTAAESARDNALLREDSAFQFAKRLLGDGPNLMEIIRRAAKSAAAAQGALREVAIPSLAYCEKRYGYDDAARLNCEAALDAESDMRASPSPSHDPHRKCRSMIHRLMAYLETWRPTDMEKADAIGVTLANASSLLRALAAESGKPGGEALGELRCPDCGGPLEATCNSEACIRRGFMEIAGLAAEPRAAPPALPAELWKGEHDAILCGPHCPGHPEPGEAKKEEGT